MPEPVRKCKPLNLYLVYDEKRNPFIFEDTSYHFCRLLPLPILPKTPSTVSKIFRYSDLPLPSSVDKISSTQLQVHVHFGGSSISVNLVALKYFGQISFHWPLLYLLLCILLVFFGGSTSDFQIICHIHSRSTVVLSSSVQDKFMIPFLLHCHIFSFKRTVFNKHGVSLLLKLFTFVAVAENSVMERIKQVVLKIL